MYNERREIGFHIVFCKDINIQIGCAVSDVRELYFEMAFGIISN